jgi:hypothetical protein
MLKHSKAYVVVPVCVASMFFVVAASAFASSGEITSAAANSTWTNGSITGSVTWTGCAEPAHCKWLPLVKDISTLESCPSSVEEDLQEASYIKTIWNGGGQTANGTVAINRPSAYILSGVYGQRACLVVIYSTWHTNPVCEAQRKVLEEFLHETPPPCAVEEFSVAQKLAQRNFVVETASAPPKEEPKQEAKQETPPTPSSTTTPTAPSITVFSSSAGVKLPSGTGTMTAGCSAASSETCTFTLTLVATVNGAHASSAKHVTVGTVTGTVPGGRSGKLTVKLNSRGRNYLKHNTLHLEAKGTVTNTAGLVTKLTRRLTVKKK